MSAEDKLAYQRLSVWELAERLGNVREACRQRGVSRTQFYEYKRRFQTHGIEGLKDLSHSQVASPDDPSRSRGAHSSVEPGQSDARLQLAA